MTMKKIVFILHCLIFSTCQYQEGSIHESKKLNDTTITCIEKISQFNYPADIELLEGKNYICDTQQFNKINIKTNKDDLKIHEGLKVLFADKNYSLAEYDLRTRILVDKKENLWLIFKASEPGNFYFNKPGYKEVYGLNNIYIVNEYLIPLFSISKSKILKYRIDRKMEVIESIEISLINSKISHNIDKIDYSELLKLSKEIKSSQFQEVGKWQKSYYKADLFLWTD
jgi:hypothetical protein